MQFTIEELFWNTRVFHPDYVTGPSELIFHQHGMDTHQAGASVNVCVWDLILPPNPKYLPKAV